MKEIFVGAGETRSPTKLKAVATDSLQKSESENSFGTNCKKSESENSLEQIETK